MLDPETLLPWLTMTAEQLGDDDGFMPNRKVLPSTCLADMPVVCHKSDPSTVFIGEDHSSEDHNTV